MSEKVEIRLARIEENLKSHRSESQARHDSLCSILKPLVAEVPKLGKEVVSLKRDRVWIVLLIGGLAEWFRGK